MGSVETFTLPKSGHSLSQWQRFTFFLYFFLLLFILINELLQYGKCYSQLPLKCPVASCNCSVIYFYNRPMKIQCEWKSLIRHSSNCISIMCIIKLKIQPIADLPANGMKEAYDRTQLLKVYSVHLRMFVDCLDFRSVENPCFNPRPNIKPYHKT